MKIFGFEVTRVKKNKTREGVHTQRFYFNPETGKVSSLGTSCLEVTEIPNTVKMRIGKVLIRRFPIWRLEQIRKGKIVLTHYQTFGLVK